MRAIAITGLISALLVLSLTAGLATAAVVVGWHAGARLAERA